MSNTCRPPRGFLGFSTTELLWRTLKNGREKACCICKELLHRSILQAQFCKGVYDWGNNWCNWKMDMRSKIGVLGDFGSMNEVWWNFDPSITFLWNIQTVWDNVHANQSSDLRGLKAKRKEYNEINMKKWHQRMSNQFWPFLVSCDLIDTVKNANFYIDRTEPENRMF